METKAKSEHNFASLIEFQIPPIMDFLSGKVNISIFNDSCLVPKAGQNLSA